MKGKKMLMIIALLAAIVSVFNTVGLVTDAFFYTIEDLPEGNLVETIASPDGENEVSVYLIDNALGTAIRCELDGKEGSRNIYWVTGINKADVKWKDNDRVTINGVTLDIADGSYDSRKINEELDSFLSENIF